MSKTNKLIKASLACALIFGSAGAVTGCNKDNDTVEETKQEEIYNLYVQYMNAKGENPLTYEQWLVSIKGEKGDKGDPGEDAIAPKVRINETTNYWEISTDNGLTWTSTGIKATGNDGVDTSYSEYQVIFDYKNFEEVFIEVVEGLTINSTQWINNLPQVKEEYEEVFLGWFIKGTEKQINNFDFIGGHVILEARFSKPHHVILDKIAPNITLIGDTIIYIDVGTPYVELGATAIDNVDGDISNKVVITGNVNVNELGSYYIKYDVVDACGNNAASVYRQVVVRDTTAPVITLVGDSEISFNYGQEYVELGAYAIDANDGNVEVIVDNSKLKEAPGRYAIYYRAYDESGNMSEVIRYVNIVDVTLPVITLVGDTIIYLEVGTTYQELGARAIDAEDGELTYKIVITNNIDINKVGTYYVKYDVVDAYGNNAISVYRQVVVRDTIKPVITLNGDSEIVLIYGRQYEELGATAIDEVDGEVEVIIDDGELRTEPGVYFVHYIAIDKSGNRQQISRKVIVVDVNEPIITLIGSQYLYLEVGEEYEELGARANDDVDGDISSEIVTTGSVNVNKVGTYTVSYDVEDSSGNKALTVTRTVIVRDTIAPVITLNGYEEIVLSYGQEYVEPGATAIDAVDGEVQVDIDSSELKEDIGEYSIYYTATDKSGNVSQTVIRKVIIVDAEKPIITLIGDQYIYLEVGEQYIEYGAKANDLVDGNISNKIVTTGNVNINKVGTYIVSYDVEDSLGNKALTVTRTVIVSDTTPPNIFLNGEETIYLEIGEEYEELGAIVFDSNEGMLDNKLVITGEVNVEEIGTYYVYYDAEDSFENKAERKTRTIIVRDTIAPVITLNGDSEITLNYGENYVEYGATAIDAVDGTVQVFINSSELKTTIGRYAIYYTATDQSGNTSDLVIRYVNIVDTVAPQIVLLGEETIYLDVGEEYEEFGALVVDAEDLDIASKLVITGEVNVEEPGTYYVHYDVEDSFGNKATRKTRTIIVGEVEE